MYMCVGGGERETEREERDLFHNINTDHSTLANAMEELWKRWWSVTLDIFVTSHTASSQSTYLKVALSSITG